MHKLTNKQIRHYSKLVNLLRVLKFYKIDYEQQPGTNRFLAHCPFHDDQHPSLTIYHNDDDTYSFCCYACGEAGDAFKFIRLQEDDFKKALTRMLELLGKDKIDASLLGWFKQLQQESKHRENIKDVIFAYRYGLGVYCRDWLIDGELKWSNTMYKKNSKMVDELFIEMDLFFNSCDSEQKADLFYNNKIKLLMDITRDLES